MTEPTDEAAGSSDEASDDAACPACGEVNEPDARRCASCGMSFTDDAGSMDATDLSPTLSTRQVPIVDFIATPGWMKLLAWIVLIGGAALLLLAIVLAIKMGFG